MSSSDKKRAISSALFSSCFNKLFFIISELEDVTFSRVDLNWIKTAPVSMIMVKKITDKMRNEYFVCNFDFIFTLSYFANL